MRETWEKQYIKLLPSAKPRKSYIYKKNEQNKKILHDTKMKAYKISEQLKHWAEEVVHISNYI